ncbi:MULTISPECIES: hypothetical protein [Oleiagrimonas]|uniref:Uncharacterized protein n=1 Tax=Oleiagrimonas citrea TaxID=1665687 RepID=A0A846ZRB5_9GAMM|nr:MULTISPECIES: hypothetical protein [Oleiagrimonas]NKZ40049.1 hypothetical protein [Oleiagrimonas citrea]RAP57148.1 hypothetical protein BTJ49_11340 [Oleiagrimonas sp. MCCC 1A03011]
MHTPITPRRARALIALIWMACGLLLLCTPLAWPNRVLGFSTLFWLIGAPACLLIALQPRLPLRLLAPARNRRLRRPH